MYVGVVTFGKMSWNLFTPRLSFPSDTVEVKRETFLQQKTSPAITKVKKEDRHPVLLNYL